MSDDADAVAILKALRDSKGPGNFRNLFLHMPGGGKGGVQIIPVGEVVAKDEFTGIKNISRDDVLAAHRVPPQLVGIVPVNNVGFGDVTRAVEAFFQLEIMPLMSRFLEANEWIWSASGAIPAVPTDQSGAWRGVERAPWESLGGYSL